MPERKSQMHVTSNTALSKEKENKKVQEAGKNNLAQF